MRCRDARSPRSWRRSGATPRDVRRRRPPRARRAIRSRATRGCGEPWRPRGRGSAASPRGPATPAPAARRARSSGPWRAAPIGRRAAPRGREPRFPLGARGTRRAGRGCGGRLVCPCLAERNPVPRPIPATGESGDTYWMNGYNFTDRVRKVLQLAREEAARLHHEYVGPEHILLGLIRDGEGVGVAVLTNLNVDLEQLSRRTDASHSSGWAAGRAD